MVDIAADVETAMRSLHARREALRAHLAQLPHPPGLVRVDDQTFLTAVQQMIDLYPPQPIRTPGGAVVVESPWIVMLPFVAGGGDVLNRIEAIKRKSEAVV